jgi:hypothetical protein
MEELGNEHRMSSRPRAADRDIPCKQGKLKTDSRYIVNPYKIIYYVLGAVFGANARRLRGAVLTALLGSAIRRVAGCSVTPLVGSDGPRRTAGSRAG